LEYLEDKLRELRFVSPESSDQRCVLLGQMDSVRRELVEIVYANVDKIVYAKELLRDILNFASADDEENPIVTPRRGSRVLSESTPRGKRTPAVPDSLEGSVGKRGVSNPPTAPRTSRTDGRNATPGQWSEEELKTNQRKYSTYSRTLMVTDEDIYGPKVADRVATPDAQRYGGTVKVKELLAKAEQGLSTVAAAQSERRTAPRVLDEDTAMNQITPRHWDPIVGDPVDLPGMTEGVALSRHAAPWNRESRGLASISPEARFSPSSPSKYSENTGPRIRRKIEPHLRTSQGGLAAAICKLAGLSVVAGGIAAAVIAVSIIASKQKSSETKKGTKKKKRKGNSKLKRPSYRGEADVPVLEQGSYLDEAIYFEEAAWDDSNEEQAPVMNVHKPPASENFPSNPPDVTAAMG
jgi:hypothetical protein